MSNWFLQTKERTFSSPSQQLPFLFLSPPPPILSPQFNLNNKVTPSILIIIIILALIFFISGLLHLLVRFLFRPPNTNPSAENDHTALEGQLQQLFHLHDSGVDQSFIDALPVFDYKAVTRVKGAFDCAVCLSEFEFEDKLRLLPKCSHAFHVNCIDTWLLSHSTCPLCRASLVGDDIISRCSPLVMILESGSQSSRERVLERENGSSDDEDGVSEEKVVSVKLGKFRSVNGEVEGTLVPGEAHWSLFEGEDCWDSRSSDVNGDVRRCFSMGAFAYVMDENSSLKVPIKASMEKDYSKKLPGQMLALSECGKIEIQSGDNKNNSIVSSKRESFSVSKIWLRGGMESSRRAFSSRFPMHRNADSAGESATMGGGGNQCNSLEREGDYPSFGRRTLLWLMGKQNKVVFSSNV